MIGHVLIVGGGIIGASTAWELARRGESVTILEANTLGSEASWAGAGMLVPGSEFDQPCQALDFAIESLGLYPGFVGGLEEASGCAIDFSQCGSLELMDLADGDADDAEAAWRSLQTKAQRQRNWGIPNEIVTAADVSRRVPGVNSGLAGAVFYPREGQVDPRTVIRALRCAFQRLPVTLRQGAPVTRMECLAGRVVATLQSGEQVEAARAVLAAGAWSSLIEVPGVPVPKVFPVKGHLVGYRLEANSLPHVLRHQHTYLVQRRDGYTIAGASVEHAGFDRTVDGSIAADLASRAATLVPGLLKGPPCDAWIGFRPGTHDTMPYVGRYEDSPLWFACGHYRNGILLAPATAKRVAEEMLAAAS